MPDQNPAKFIPNGLWIPLPVNAIKYLAKHHRPADRVFYALCLHLGKGLVAVFPSYPTIARYSCVGEKQLRSHFDKLIELGFISIEKRRRGKENQNYYTILPKAWTFRSKPKEGKQGPSLDSSQQWMCQSCYEYVYSDNAEFIRKRDWYGQDDNHWIHTNCIKPWESRRVLLLTRGLLIDRENYLVEQEVYKSRRNNS
jgi:hypothetical protein